MRKGFVLSASKTHFLFLAKLNFTCWIILNLYLLDYSHSIFVGLSSLYIWWHFQSHWSTNVLNWLTSPLYIQRQFNGMRITENWKEILFSEREDLLESAWICGYIWKKCSQYFLFKKTWPIEVTFVSGVVHQNLSLFLPRLQERERWPISIQSAQIDSHFFVHLHPCINGIANFGSKDTTKL